MVGTQPVWCASSQLRPEGDSQCTCPSWLLVLCLWEVHKSPLRVLPKVPRADFLCDNLVISILLQGLGSREALPPTLPTGLQVLQGTVSARAFLLPFSVPWLLPMGSLTGPGSNHDHSPTTLIFFLRRTGI